MSFWNFLSVVDGADSDDRYYPILSAEGQDLPVGLTSAEGVPIRFLVSSLRVLEQGKQGLSEAIHVPSELDFTLVVTDERLIAYCVKFERGSRWFGTGAGAVVAVAAMAISAAAAARRRKGKVLAGHLRYQWVTKIIAKEHTGWGEPATIRLAVNRPDSLGGSPFVVEFILHKSVDVLSIASDLARRVAIYRLGFDDVMEPQERDGFLRLATGGRLPMGTKADGTWDWAEYDMPTSWPVTRATRPEPAAIPAPHVGAPDPPVREPEALAAVPPATGIETQSTPGWFPELVTQAASCRCCTHALPGYARSCPRCGAPVPV